MENKLISVIMPAYNSSKTIAKSIESALNQTYSNIELVIVDDSSADNTADIIQSYAIKDSRIRYFKNEENSGVAQTRHNAVMHANGDYLAFLDSDDLWKPDKLEKQIQYINDYDLIFTASSFINSEGIPYQWIMEIPESITYKQLLKQNVISCSSVLIKKEVFLNNEVLDRTIHEDFACWLNVLKNGNKVLGINEPLLIYRLSRNSKTGNKFKSVKMNWATYRRTNLSILHSAWFELCYLNNGIKKYKHLLK